MFIWKDMGFSRLWDGSCQAIDFFLNGPVSEGGYAPLTTNNRCLRRLTFCCRRAMSVGCLALKGYAMHRRTNTYIWSLIFLCCSSSIRSRSFLSSSSSSPPSPPVVPSSFARLPRAPPGTAPPVSHRFTAEEETGLCGPSQRTSGSDSPPVSSLEEGSSIAPSGGRMRAQKNKFVCFSWRGVQPPRWSAASALWLQPRVPPAAFLASGRSLIGGYSGGCRRVRFVPSHSAGMAARAPARSQVRNLWLPQWQTRRLTLLKKLLLVETYYFYLVLLIQSYTSNDDIHNGIVQHCNVYFSGIHIKIL